ncbi:hypothetical protein GLW08_07990 [Pontibacillus yanchengensis]|uniref:Uncharacterized protein n=2 Tax=Pontibacillus yanchengensis TaxID=462910 RepID=A0ACC7VGM5_9BACI|nr:hypothetical protein [Pontibacillus yanchengensis]MYL34186.1 hypothetical protein [Pontibacillus yanchengensis]MYL53279.1 hypothetical protein [Pontibacillus yanchengensis]
MPNQKQNTHSQTSPHPDGEKEGVINDSTGKKMGVTSQSNVDWNRKDHPIELQPDEKMKDFKKTMENLL